VPTTEGLTQDGARLYPKHYLHPTTIRMELAEAAAVLVALCMIGMRLSEHVMEERRVVGSDQDYPGPCICAWFSHVTRLAEAKLAREGRHDDRLPKLRGELSSRRAIRSLHTTPYFFSTIVTLPISQTVLP
jgi:hypothetical protein